MRAPENGKEEKGSASGKAGGKRRTRAQTGETPHAKRGAGLWRPEAAPCPREGTHGIAGSRPFAPPQEQADAGPSRALHLRGARTCTRSPRFWPRNRVLARDGTTARDTENAEQAFCRRKRRTDNAKEGLKESFRARTEARQEVGPPEAVRGRPGGPGGAAGRGPHARGGGEGAPRRGESKNPAAPPSGVWWPKTTDSRARRRGACCALAVQTRKAATTRQPRPSRKCRQIPISVSARRAQPRQSREGPPPRSARRR